MKTPIAIWLAEKLDEEIKAGNKAGMLLINSANQLRRQHEMNQALVEALRAALEALRGSAGPDEIANAREAAKIAIFKTTGTQA